MNDDWMDAFAPEDLDDPALARIDAAVQPPAPRRRWWPLAIPIALAAAAALWLGVPAPPAIQPVESVPIAVVDAGDVVSPGRRVAQTDPTAPSEEERIDDAIPEAPVVVAVVQPNAPAPETVETPVSPAPPEPAPPVQKRPGLQLRPGALARLDGDAAVLQGGVLVYRHDAGHEPGVRRVRFADPPLVARPVGTAFSAASRAGYAAVRVTEGEVWLERDDGRGVAALRPGDEMLVFRDGDELAWIATGGLSIDAVVQALPRAQRRDERTLVSLLASLRLAAREGLTDAKVPFVLGGER